MPKRVVVLGAGATGEAFVAALRKLDGEAEVTIVEHELVGGECSYWACIPSKVLLRPLEVIARARLAPGAAEAVGAVDPARVFWWRDQIAEKDDASQAEWVAKQGAELVRGTGVVAEPGLVTVGARELPYDALLVATGSVPVTPPIEGLAEVPYWGSREGTSASAVPKTLAVVGGGPVGCELAQAYARLGARVTLVQGGGRLLPRLDAEAAELLAGAFAEEGIELRFDARATRVEGGGGRPFRLELEGQDPVVAEKLLCRHGPQAERRGLRPRAPGPHDRGARDRRRRRPGRRRGRLGGRGRDRRRALHPRRQVPGQDRRAERRRGKAKADYRAIPASVFTDPQVAAAGDTSGEGAVTSTWRLESVSRTGTFQRPKQPGLVKLYADPARRVLVGATAVGPEAGEWIGQLTLAIRAEVPVDVLRDTIQPFPTFSEAVYFAARDLAL